MSHEIDQSTGKPAMAYVGAAPWHGLGSQLTEDASIEQWQEAAGLNWEVQFCPVTYRWGKSQLRVPDRNVLVRNDTGASLGVVSNDYQVVQPHDVMEFFRDLVDGIGGFKMETAGSLRGGRKIWALAKAPASESIDLAGTKSTVDRIERYLLLATSFDKSLPTIVQQTSTRVVCSNTLRMAFNDGQSGVETRAIIKHFAKFDADRIKQQLALDEQWHKFGLTIEKLSRKRVTPVVARQYFTDLLYASEEQAAKDFNKKIAERNVGQFMDLYAGAPGQDTLSAKATAWGLVNAVTYYVDHKAKSLSNDVRLDKAWFGKGDEQKVAAAQLALTLV